MKYPWGVYVAALLVPVMVLVSPLIVLFGLDECDGAEESEY